MPSPSHCTFTPFCLCSQLWFITRNWYQILELAGGIINESNQSIKRSSYSWLMQRQKWLLPINGPQLSQQQTVTMKSQLTSRMQNDVNTKPVSQICIHISILINQSVHINDLLGCVASLNMQRTECNIWITAAKVFYAQQIDRIGTPSSCLV